MLEASPADWPRLAGFAVARAEVIDADVSTVTAATDKVLRVHGDRTGVMHFDFQAGPDAALPRRMHGYNALLENRHELPVLSVAVLLRPEANLRAISGVYERRFPGEAEPYLTFRYHVIRVWELPPERFLAGGPGILPLAPIGAVTESDLPGVIERLKKKLDTPRYRKVAGPLWTAVDVLMGLRYDRAMVEHLLQGVRGMKESVTYQAIVEEGVVKGRLEEARGTLYFLGEQKFKKPAGPLVRAAIERINDPDELRRLSARVMDVGGWDELVADLPRTRRRRSERK
jgi:predicted transposase YdaD